MEVAKSTLGFFCQSTTQCKGIPVMNREYHDRFLLLGGLLELLVAIFCYYNSNGEIISPIISSAAMLFLAQAKRYNSLKILVIASNMILVYQIKSLDSKLFILPVQIILSLIKISILTKCFVTSLCQLIFFSVLGTFYVEKNFKRIFFTYTQEELWGFFSQSILFTFFMSIVAVVYLGFYNAQSMGFVKEVEKLQESLRDVNDKLKTKNEELQQTLKLKDLYVLTFSHELKNALNALLGNIELSLIETKDSKIVNYLQSAFASGQSISNFVHNMLETGKIENGSFEIVKEPTDVPSFLQKTWLIVREMIRNKRLDGSLSVSSNVPRFLEIDEQRLQQKIINLVSNAIKFTEKGYIRVIVGWNKDFPESPSAGENINSEVAEAQKLKISGEKRLFLGSWGYVLNLDKKHWTSTEKFTETEIEGDKGILTIQVIDSGCGIHGDDIPKLCERFRQAQQARETRARGNGLGLWITKQLLMKQGGEIHIQSKQNYGSTFTMKIPTKTTKCPSLSMNYVEETVGSSNARRESGKLGSQKHDMALKNSLSLIETTMVPSKKVLIVDDDTFNVELMQNFLNKLQIPYLVGYDGKDAIEIVKSQAAEICLIITDNYMPGILGIQAAPQIRKHYAEKKIPQIPIFCVSADETAQFKDECKAAGMDGLLRKPIDFAKFKELVLKYTTTYQ